MQVAAGKLVDSLGLTGQCNEATPFPKLRRQLKSLVHQLGGNVAQLLDGSREFPRGVSGAMVFSDVEIMLRHRFITVQGRPYFPTPSGGERGRGAAYSTTVSLPKSGMSSASGVGSLG